MPEYASVLVDALSQKYRTQPFPVESPDTVRVVVRVRPTKVVAYR